MTGAELAEAASVAQTRMEKYLTTEDIAALLRTSVETVRYWRHIGNGPKSFKVGRRVLYASEDVERWISDARAARVA